MQTRYAVQWNRKDDATPALSISYATPERAQQAVESIGRVCPQINVLGIVEVQVDDAQAERDDASYV
jgi:hypothetical protein